MTQETKKIAKEKKKLNMMLGDKILILTAIGIMAYEGLVYFTNPVPYSGKEPKKIEKTEPNFYEPNIYEPNNFNKPYNLKNNRELR